MSKKQFYFCFVAEYVSLILTAVCLWYFTRHAETQIELPVADATFAYAFGAACALLTILCSFLALRQSQWNPLLRLAMLVTPACMVIIDYYLLADSNMLYCLPVLAVVSFMLLYKVMQS
ncbi:MAG: hypothetical protein II681_07350 [Bacteroidaceae bacterium]|nr:hypothetical protein [Bacteroidaceae bacterium]MBQ2459200.1 hypothetical protein [Bacteroidaceae bacterium]MBQ2518877.1 hypothetical protein [Bacteroidaceae bacterium]MBQ3958657.1 hypothetical protein [Bacteroidaceae bacterium]MBQ3992122.1 hypothetical protein [Bacteroidaceae bacterium]